MEIGALQGELRRARQELGASEAGRREVGHDITECRLRRSKIGVFLCRGTASRLDPTPPLSEVEFDLTEMFRQQQGAGDSHTV